MGLYDRDYMNSAGTAGGNSRQMLWSLIIINVIAYFMRFDFLALTIGKVFTLSNVLQIVTAGFYHKSFLTMVFNMWGLYIFGSLVTPRTNGFGILLLYLAGAISGNILFALSSDHSAIPFFGAIGAVCAMMTAAAMLEPERRFMLIIMPFTPIKITTLVIVYTLFDVLSGVSMGMIYLSHLAGFIGGYAVMKILFGKNVAWDPLRFGGASRQKPGSFNRPRPVPPKPADGNSAAGHAAPVTQKELDALLDKLSTGGINSLSDYELERLKKARRQMRGEE